MAQIRDRRRLGCSTPEPAARSTTGKPGRHCRRAAPAFLFDGTVAQGTRYEANEVWDLSLVLGAER